MKTKRLFPFALMLFVLVALAACAAPAVDVLVEEEAAADTGVEGVAEEGEAVAVQEAEEPAVEEAEEPAAVDLNAAYTAFLDDMQGYDIVTVEALSEELAEAPPFLLDVRQPEEVEEAGYIEGAINVPLREVAQNLDLLPAFDEPIVVYCGSGWRSTIAMTGLGALGWTDVRSMKGGFGAWTDAGYPAAEGVPPAGEALNVAEPDPALVSVMDEMFSNLPEGWGVLPVEGLAEELADNPDDLVLIDVRRDAEVIENGMIEGAVHIPLEEFVGLQAMWPAEDANIVVYCAAGHRGNIAATILRSYGYTDVRNLKGGFGAWVDVGNPVAGGLAGAYTDFLADMEGYDIITVESLNEALAEAPPFLLDVRQPEEVEEAGYIEGAINVPLREVAQNLDLLPAFDEPIVVYCGSGWRSTIAMTGLGALGWTDVRSMKGGFGAWTDAGYPAAEGVPPAGEALNAAEPDPALVSVMDEMFSNLPEGWGVLPVEGLAEELAENSDLVLVDVRRAEEVAENGVIEGAVNIPLEEFVAMKGQWPAADANIVVYCAAGHRGNIAATILRSYGYTDVRNLKGGFGAWVDAGNPVVDYVTAYLAAAA